MAFSSHNLATTLSLYLEEVGSASEAAELIDVLLAMIIAIYTTPFVNAVQESRKSGEPLDVDSLINAGNQAMLELHSNLDNAYLEVLRESLSHASPDDMMRAINTIRKRHEAEAAKAKEEEDK